jgi:wyosine [tRNA(Phe)-imidazoG37] synthetase (radical SAM superfamily)
MNSCKFLFGPVPSRRLGASLGVDLVPHKVCTFDCIYCQCGRTTNLTAERREYVPYDRVISELTHFLGSNPAPDYITFSGSGEPTLNVRIGDIIRFVKNDKPDIPVAVLTNGSLLFDKKVRTELCDADVVLPSLDAASESCFQMINWPFYRLNIRSHIHGLARFATIFRGKIWLEIFIIPTYNDGEKELMLFKRAIEMIEPDLIQLNTLDRPGNLHTIRSASKEELKEISDLWGFDNVEIIADLPLVEKNVAFRRDIQEAILDTISRRPSTPRDLAQIAGVRISEIFKYLSKLEKADEVEAVREDRGYFYRLKVEK